MHRFRTWKQMQTTFNISRKGRSLNSFLKEELSDSRRTVLDVIKEKPIIDFGAYHSNILGGIKQKCVKRNNTTT